MKAWRKHNQKIASRIQELQFERAVDMWVYKNPKHEVIQEHNKKIAEKKKEYLRTKTERRGHFQTTATFPGNLLLALFKKAGLPTPQIMP
jgi:hypothetical protein